MRFYLTTHEPGWLKRPEMVGRVFAEDGEGRAVETFGDVPLFISRHRLARILEKGHRLPRAVTPWVLDSGGFTQLHPKYKKGSWDDVPAHQYVEEVRRFYDEIGMMEWAAPQDWMCEPEVLAYTTRFVHGPAIEFMPPALEHAVAQHQVLTCQSYLWLREQAPEIPWAPILQGWNRAQYHRHVDLYESYGVDLTSEELPVVGVGSVCRRVEGPGRADVFLGLSLLFDELRERGIPNLHAFGFKATGLLLSGGVLSSSDSMAWSTNARVTGQEMRRLAGGGKKGYAGALPGHATPGFIDPWSKRRNQHKACANCIVYALLWRARLLWRLAHEGEPHWRMMERINGIGRAPRFGFEHTKQVPRRKPPTPAAMVVPNREVSKGVFEELPRPRGAPVPEDDREPKRLMKKQIELWEDE